MFEISCAHRVLISRMCSPSIVTTGSARMPEGVAIVFAAIRFTGVRNLDSSFRRAGKVQVNRSVKPGAQSLLATHSFQTRSDPRNLADNFPRTRKIELGTHLARFGAFQFAIVSRLLANN